MITCPVNATDDFASMSKEGNSNYPRALIQLINRKYEMPEQAENISADILEHLKYANKFN